MSPLFWLNLRLIKIMLTGNRTLLILGSTNVGLVEMFMRMAAKTQILQAVLAVHYPCHTIEKI